ncbi:hypothetical protein AB0J90_12095 [Micromonospora sp. NPDC049523]|uniref:hypothetical protein n=1 Tax=Micromonospora sp. NPDC049523 TaxID=3155921 RepID=UPI00342E2FB4
MSEFAEHVRQEMVRQREQQEASRVADENDRKLHATRVDSTLELTRKIVGELRNHRVEMDASVVRRVQEERFRTTIFGRKVPAGHDWVDERLAEGWWILREERADPDSRTAELMSGTYIVLASTGDVWYYDIDGTYVLLDRVKRSHPGKDASQADQLEWVTYKSALGRIWGNLDRGLTRLLVDNGIDVDFLDEEVGRESAD